MSMRVDQPGQDGRIRKIDDLIRRRGLNLSRRTDVDDLVAFNHDGLAGQSLPAPHIEYVTRPDNDPLTRLCCRGLCY